MLVVKLFLFLYNILCLDVLYVNLIRDSWNEEDYREFINYLFEIRDIKYKEFHSGLSVGNNAIGIRTPILKKMAIDISNGNYREFLSLLKENYYEEVTLYGLIICNIKEIGESVKYLNIYKERINNWASCDLFCTGYKIVVNYKDYF